MPLLFLLLGAGATTVAALLLKKILEGDNEKEPNFSLLVESERDPVTKEPVPVYSVFVERSQVQRIVDEATDLPFTFVQPTEAPGVMTIVDWRTGSQIMLIEPQPLFDEGTLLPETIREILETQTGKPEQAKKAVDEMEAGARINEAIAREVPSVQEDEQFGIPPEARIAPFQIGPPRPPFGIRPPIQERGFAEELAPEAGAGILPTMTPEEEEELRETTLFHGARVFRGEAKAKEEAERRRLLKEEVERFLDQPFPVPEPLVPGPRPGGEFVF